MRVESDPVAKFEEQFDSMFWMSVPYHHPVIGWPSDVESINRQEANDFFDTFYAPNNLTAAIVGDVDPAEAMALAKKYFGRIPRGQHEPPQVITEEIDQLNERRMSAEADTNPTVELRWHTVPFVHKDVFPLEVMAGILQGRTGRLYKSLVEEKKLATGEPYGYNRPMKFGGYFEIGAEVADGHTHQEVEQALLAQIDLLKKAPVGEHELQKVKNQSMADSFRKLQSNFYLLLQLLVYDAMGDWHFINESPAKLDAVTAEDIQRVAKTYFTPEGLNAMWYSRKEGSEQDPELAALSGRARQMAKGMLTQIGQVKDAGQLTQVVTQLQGALDSGQVPQDARPALELVIRRTQERLKKLQAAGGEEK